MADFSTSFSTYGECIAALSGQIRLFDSTYKMQDDLFQLCQNLSRQIQKNNLCAGFFKDDLATCKKRVEACGYASMTSPMIAPQGVFYQSEEITTLAAGPISDILQPVPRFNWSALLTDIANNPGPAGGPLAACNQVFNGKAFVPTKLWSGKVVQKIPGQPITYWNNLLYENTVSLNLRKDILLNELLKAIHDYNTAFAPYQNCCNVLNLLIAAGCKSKRCNDPSDPIEPPTVRNFCVPASAQNDGVI